MDAFGVGTSPPLGVATAPGTISMETVSPGPLRTRINPFSSSSSTFSSRAEGRAGAGAGTFSGSEGRLEAPMGVESLKRSYKPQGRVKCLPASSLAQRTSSFLPGWRKMSSKSPS